MVMRWPKRRGKGAKTERGFVLVVVIWMSILIALLAATFASSVRTHIRVAGNLEQAARAEAVADAGIQLAILDLLAVRKDRLRPRRFAIDGSHRVCAWDDESTLVIEIEDESGKVSLNTASDRLLTVLFLGLGMGQQEAERNTARLLDFRDQDDNARPEGAEREEYAAAGPGKPRAPKNANIETIDELEQVLGFTPDLVSRLKPYVSAHSTIAGIDPNAASKSLKSIIAAARWQSLTGNTSANEGELSADETLPAEFAASSNQRIFLARAEARLASGARFVREAIVELSATTPGKYLLRQWQQGGSAGADTSGRPPANRLPPC